MTSFPVCMKTSISPKRCMIEEKLLLNINMKPYKLLQIPLLKTIHSAPQRRYIDDVMFGLHENLIISEMVHNRRTLSMEHNWETIVSLPESVIMNCVQRPLADLAPCYDFRFARKRYYLRNGVQQTNNLNGTQLGNHGLPFRIRRQKLRTAPPSGYSTMI